MKITVCGIGRLGSPLVAVLASKGYPVTGVDVNREYVDALAAGKPPVEETGLAKLIAANRERISATTDILAAASDADVVFIAVPTPSLPDGSFSCEYAVEAARAIGEAWRDSGKWRLCVLASTVMPGHCEGLVVPALEEASGLTCGEGFSLAYNPEFIALGSVIADMLHPDFILIGESDERAGDMLSEIYSEVCGSPIARMNFICAEVAKIALNAYVTAKISYANMLAEICEALPGADAVTVTQAIGQDSRIGRKYLAPGAAFGGPCFPRDGRAFRQMAASRGLSAALSEATDEINRHQTERLTDLAYHVAGSAGRVAVLGISYKPGTSVSEESAGVAVANALLVRGLSVAAYDPRAMATAHSLNPSAERTPSMAECVDGAGVVLVMTPWPEFGGLQTDAITIDCWRIVDPAKVPNLIRIGRNG